MRYAVFLSRHEPTQAQLELAEKHALILQWKGDRDGFRCDLREFDPLREDLVVVHAGLAIRAFKEGFNVHIFENANRAPEGERPTFEAVKIHSYHHYDLEGE